jgi:hypothetical protein
VEPLRVTVISHRPIRFALGHESAEYVAVIALHICITVLEVKPAP